MVRKACAHAATDECAEPKRRQGDERCRDREAWRTSQGEAQEHDVAGHVGDEDVTQYEIAKGIDQAAHERHNKQQWPQRAIPGLGSGKDGLAKLGEQNIHERLPGS